MKRRLEDGYQCLVLVLIAGGAVLLSTAAGALLAWKVTS